MNEPRKIWVLEEVDFNVNQSGSTLVELSFDLDRLKSYANNEYGLDDDPWDYRFDNDFYYKKSTYGNFGIFIYRKDIL